MTFLDRLRRPRSTAPFPVAAQLDQLAQLGVQLAPGVTLRHVLAEPGDQQWAEQRRFGLLTLLSVTDEDGPVLTVPGVVCIDLEGAEDDDSYPHIVRLLARAARRERDLSEVSSRFDSEAADCRVEYTVSGRTYTEEPEVRDDWIDGMAVGYIAEKLTPDGLECAWWIDDNGTWCTWLPPRPAEQLMRLMQDQ